MTRETPLPPSEFLAAVRDYADSIGDERYVRVSYAGQLAAVGHPTREPLEPWQFSAALVAHAGVDVESVDRERIEYAYLRQLEIARDRAGESR